MVAYNADVLLAGGQGTNYEQSLFFLSPSCETRGTKITSVWEATDIKGKSKNLACVDGGIRRWALYSGTRLIRTPKETCHSVRIERALRENVRNTCFIDIKTKADSFTNQGSVEVCGKAVNRGGGLGMEIPCVYIFDCPRRHVELLEQLLDRR